MFRLKREKKPELNLEQATALLTKLGCIPSEIEYILQSHIPKDQRQYFNEGIRDVKVTPEPRQSGYVFLRIQGTYFARPIKGLGEHWLYKDVKERTREFGTGISI
jgi:hypothetical protein